MSGFTWSIDQPKRAHVRLVLTGEMTLGARDSMREAFESLVASPEPNAVIDFTGVRLVSSGAIGELVRCQSRLTLASRTASLICPGGDVLETLMVADMHRLLPIHSDLESLLKGNLS